MSPLADAEGPPRLTVSSEGKTLDDAVQLISVTVHREINQVPGATLVIADGDMPEGRFPVSDGSAFKPGAKIIIKAGYGGHEATIFVGVVVKHALKIAGADGARLVVDCRDEALKMTVGRKNAHYLNQSDGNVLKSLLGGFGLDASVSGAAIQHQSLVQHACTDWDFMLARAAANGCVVVVTDGRVVVGKPQTAGTADLAVGYGDSLIDFKAELDALQTFGADVQPLKSPNQSPKPRLRGSMRFQGSALAKVGGLIELNGVGQRFNVSVYITGIRHEMANGEWCTQAEFGTPPDSVAEGQGSGPPAAGRCAGATGGATGLHLGVVLKLDGDPDGEHRIQVRVPTAGIDRIWARLLQVHASSGFGTFFAPEVGDEVLLGWFDHDPGLPVVLGSLYSHQHPPPQTLMADNPIKAIVTRYKATLAFNDEDRVITLKTPAGNQVVISDKDGSIVITDQNDNRFKLGRDGIRMDSPKDIQISAKGAIHIDAVGALTLTSKADARLQALNVNCEAQIGLVAKGAASAELSASGQTTVKGAVVMIN